MVSVVVDLVWLKLIAMLEMAITAFVVGFLVAIPPGTFTVIAAHKSITHGFKYSFAFNIGSCIADIFYILIVLYGFSPLISGNDNYQLIFFILSAIMLIYMGVDTLLHTAPTSTITTQIKYNRKYLKEILSGIGITLTNPMTVAGWVVIAGGFFAHWKKDWPPITDYGWLSTIFMILGVLCWFTPLLFALSKIKKILSTRFIKLFSVFSGSFFIAMAGLSVFSAWQLALQL